MASANVGEAAHITAASDGPGARRYDKTLTREERTSIGNAIWLCVLHARLIDRDESTFTADRLREMKRQHEERAATAIRYGGTEGPRSDDLIALGLDVVALGSLVSGGNSSWEVQLSEFIQGDIGALVSFCDAFASRPPTDNYVLVNEFGDGRMLSEPPTWRRSNPGVVVACSIAAPFPRIRAQDVGESLKLGPDHDLAIPLEKISGVDAFRQRVKNCLSMGKGEWFLDRSAGSRLQPLSMSRGTC